MAKHFLGIQCGVNVGYERCMRSVKWVNHYLNDIFWEGTTKIGRSESMNLHSNTTYTPIHSKTLTNNIHHLL